MDPDPTCKCCTTYPTTKVSKFPGQPLSYTDLICNSSGRSIAWLHLHWYSLYFQLTDETNLMFSGSSGECKSTTHGSEFRGTSFIKTASGITCQRWDQDSPHSNSYNDDLSRMQKLGLQGLKVSFRFVTKRELKFICILLVKQYWDSSDLCVCVRSKNWFLAVCCQDASSFSQKITAETLTTRLRVRGVLLWIQPRDGDIVLFPDALVSESSLVCESPLQKWKHFPNIF